MSLEDRIRAAHRFDAARFVPFFAGGMAVGFVRRDLVEHLAACRDVLNVGENAISFPAGVASFEARSEAMAAVATALAARGLLSKWRDELYDIGASAGQGILFCVERAAVRFFGFTAQAVHLNGLARVRNGTRMWIAERSSDKAIDPGMFDNLVGGGIARGLSAQQTLVKEAWEEAGIGASLARQARASGMLEVCREVPDGLHVEVIHVYDLLLPAEFEPRNQDGEVAGFRALTLEQAADELAGDAPYTVDAALVAIDCLERQLPGFGDRLSSRG